MAALTRGGDGDAGRGRFRGVDAAVLERVGPGPAFAEGGRDHARLERGAGLVVETRRRRHRPGRRGRGAVQRAGAGLVRADAAAGGAVRRTSGQRRADRRRVEAGAGRRCGQSIRQHARHDAGQRAHRSLAMVRGFRAADADVATRRALVAGAAGVRLRARAPGTLAAARAGATGPAGAEPGVPDAAGRGRAGRLRALRAQARGAQRSRQAARFRAWPVRPVDRRGRGGLRGGRAVAALPRCLRRAGQRADDAARPHAEGSGTVVHAVGHPHAHRGRRRASQGRAAGTRAAPPARRARRTGAGAVGRARRRRRQRRRRTSRRKPAARKPAAAKPAAGKSAKKVAKAPARKRTR